MKRCRARTRSGKPCAGYAVHGSDYCFTHDPGSAEERRRAHSLGGHHRRAAPASPFPEIDARTAVGLSAILDRLLQDTWSLENSVERTRALAYLARVQKDLLETSMLESRVAALEAALRRRNENDRAEKA